jgi:hypothetical protein
MYLFLLKKALPFALTFVVGTALGGLTWPFGGSEKKTEAARVTRTYDFPGRCGNARRYKLVAESKPLAILFKPGAHYPGWADDFRNLGPVSVTATFGADGKVSGVKPVGDRFHHPFSARMAPVWKAVERAALGIQFEPEVVNSVPVSVTKEVEIFFD